MKLHQPILTYLLTFVALSILLKLLGIIDFNNSEILGYALIFYGISTVYITFGKERRGFLFFGSLCFLTGVLLFLINNFEFVHTGKIIIPSIIFIGGISFLMLYLDNLSNTVFLIISLVFLLTGLVLTITTGTPGIISFINSVYKIIINYWPIILIVIGIIIIVHWHDKNEVK